MERQENFPYPLKLWPGAILTSRIKVPSLGKINMDDNHHIDPEPFAILVSLAAVVGAVASTISALGILFGQDKALTETRRRIDNLLNEAGDLVRYIEADLEIIVLILSAAEISQNRRFHPRSAAFLNQVQFSRYTRTVEKLFGRLRQLLKTTHDLDNYLPRLSSQQIDQASDRIIQIQNRLTRVLQDWDQSIENATNDIRTALSEIQELTRNI